MSIQEIYQKYKSVLEDDALFYAVIIVLVAVASFGLGRHSIVTQAPQEASAAISVSQKAVSDRVIETEEQYVASKNGTRYYLMHCGGVSRINEENKVYFDSEAEALAAGYTPAANCAGLVGG